MNGKVTQEEINKVVWQACDTFRGVIDPSQYKDYILTMLFLKYVSDVSKAKYKEYLQRYDGDTERAQRAMRRERFQVPEKSSFDYLFEHRNEPNIGELIDVGLADLEYENREKTKLMASVAAISTDEAIEYAKTAKALGYDAMISTVPYYYKFGMKAISAYYGALREAVDLPLFLYNFPGNTGVELDIADDHIRGMLTDGTIAGVQKMVHIAQAEQFYEQDYYTPSDDGFHVFDTEYGKIGIVVCFDRHYPESIRTESLMGAELILIPTVNTKTEPSEMFEWELRVQAFHNSTAVAMCNRVGKEGEMDFSGESIVVDANGDVIAKADDTEGILYAEADLAKSSEIRSRRTYTGLRRTELYK